MTAGRKRADPRAKHRPAAQEAPGRPGSGHDALADPAAEHDASTTWEAAREAGESLTRKHTHFPRKSALRKQMVAEQEERQKAEQRARQQAQHAQRRKQP